MKNRASRLTATRQRGAVLVISLLLLLVMTLLGLGASQSTRLQERMAGNQRDQELALQGAEAALREAERGLERSQSANVGKCIATGPSSCQSFPKSFLVDTVARTELDLSKQTNEWWEEYGKLYDEDGEQLPELDSPPQYVIEFVDTVGDVMSVNGPSQTIEREFYRVTVRSKGLTDTAEVVLQTSFSRIEFL